MTDLLTRTYGSPRLNNKEDPLDELVFILLSQMTTGPSYERVYDRLKERFPDWAKVLAVSDAELMACIQDAGLSGQKGPRIRSIIARIVGDFGCASLDALRSQEDNDVEAYLTSLPGVGPKTAKCVMMYSLGRAVLPVDTHVARVARRLGLVDPDESTTGIHAALEGVIAPVDRYAFHVNALSHGRRVCIALRPRCRQCFLRLKCRYGLSASSE